MKKLENVSLVMLAGMLCSCSSAESSKEELITHHQAVVENSSTPNTPLDLSTIPFTHPVSNVGSVNGMYPGVNLHTSPAGRRYTTADRISEDEQGYVTVQSGVFELETETVTPAELFAVHGSEYEFALANHDHGFSVIGKRLQDYLDDNPSNDKVPVSLWFDDSANADKRMIASAIELDIAQGAIQNLADYKASRDAALSAEVSRLNSLQVGWINDIQNVVGGSESDFLVSGCTYFPCLEVMLTPSEIQQVVDSVSSVKQIDFHTLGQSETNPSKSETDKDAFLAGFNMKGMQAEHILNAGYDGNLPDSSHGYRVGVLEAGRTDTAHYAFFDWITSDPKQSRNKIKSNYGCTKLSNNYYDCEDEMIRSYGDSENWNSAHCLNAIHATNMAGYIGGQILQNQDPAITGLNAQDARSGYGMELDFDLAFMDTDRLIDSYGEDPCSINIDGSVFKQVLLDMTNSYTNKVYSNLIDRDPIFINTSQGDRTADPDCRGFDTWSRTVDSVYEKGLLTIKSAGNKGIGEERCTITSPGSAASALTIAALDTYLPVGSTIEHYNGKRHKDSSIGGEIISNRVVRSIVDLTSASLGQRIPTMKKTYMDSSNYSDGGPGYGTSNAAAMTSSVLGLFFDSYVATVGSLIEDPGILFVNALLMGDRMSRFNPIYNRTTRLDAGYDQYHGAGRMKTRMYNGAGMDGPAAFVTGRVCVAENQRIYIPITWAFNQVVPGKSDILKVATYWYDPDHKNGSYRDTFYSYILTEPPGSPNQIIARDGHYGENKTRIAIDDLNNYSGHSMELIIDGIRVGGSNTRCGSNANMVYYAIYFEDTERNDSNGPSLSEVGIED